MTRLNDEPDETAMSTGKDSQQPQQEAFDDAFPLTPQQQRLWEIDQAVPGLSIYNGAFRLEITGPLNPSLLETAFRYILERHEILRAAVRVIDGKACLVIRNDLKAKIAVSELRMLAAEAAEARMEDLCAIEAHKAFDLSNDVLVRVGLIRMSEQRSILTVTVHQIVGDGFTVSGFVEGLTDIYADLAQGRPIDVTPPPLQFGDYATWMDEQISSGGLKDQIDYWKSQLEGYRRLDVAPDSGHLHAGHFDSEIIARQLPTSLTDKLLAGSRERGSTLFTTSMAAMLLLLGDEASTTDVSVGMPMTGRDSPDLEQIMGPLVNYCVLRADIAGCRTFAEFETRVRAHVLDALANQTVPLEVVGKAMQQAGAVMPNPLFSVCFICQTAFGGGSSLQRSFHDCSFRSLPSRSPGALYDLFFFLVGRRDGWRLSLDFRTQRYSSKRANELLDRMYGLLDGIAHNPETPLADLIAQARMSAAHDADSSPEARSLETADADHGDCFVLPASHVQERYWLLSQAAPKSAGHNVPACLRIKGPLDIAALETSLKMTVARHEALRTSFREIEGDLKQIIRPECETVLKRTRIDGTASLADAIAASTRAPFDLSKGPLVRAELFELADNDHVLAITLHHIICDGQSVSVIQDELWRGYQDLIDGGRIAVAQPHLQYGDVASSQRDWCGTPAAREQLDQWTTILKAPLPIQDFPLDAPPLSSRTSEAGSLDLPLSTDLVAKLKAAAQTDGTTMFTLTASAFAATIARYGLGTDVLFGCPVGNRTADTERVVGPFAGPLAVRLDLANNPTLHQIVQQTRGYMMDALGRVDIPFDLILEDLNVRSTSGRTPFFQFYFVYQNAFLQQRQTRDLTLEPVPTAGANTPYELQLVLVERAGAVSAQAQFNKGQLTDATVRNVLAYFEMVLTEIVSRPGLRLQELPVPNLGSSQRFGITTAAAEYRAAETATEAALTEIWQRLLNVPNVGIDDDFFHLGGQSILAARLVVEIKKTLDAKIEISTVAFARTIRRMAEVIDKRVDGDAPRLIPMRPTGRKTPLFVVHCGGGHVLRYEDLVSLLPSDRPVFGLAAPDLDGAKELPSVEALAKLYIEEIQRVQPTGPYHIAGYSFGGLVAYEMARLLSAKKQRVGLVAILDTMNRSHYRRLSFSERFGMKLTYFEDRLRKHLHRLLAGEFKAFASTLAKASVKRFRALALKATRLSYRLMGKPLPLGVESALDRFATVAARYRPAPWNGRVLVIHAEGRGPEFLSNPALGWQDAALDGVEVRFVPGDHMTFMKKPHVEVLRDHLVEVLEKYEPS